MKTSAVVAALSWASAVFASPVADVAEPPPPAKSPATTGPAPVWQPWQANKPQPVKQSPKPFTQPLSPNSSGYPKPTNSSASVPKGRKRVRKTLRPQNRTSAATGRRLPSGKMAQDTYSSNWAGAVLIGSGYTKVTGNIVVPDASEPPGAYPGTSYTASAWVGIDGDTCDSAILQTGVDMNIQDGVPSFDAWYEWYPDYSYNFDGFEMSAGDEISMTVTATSGTSGSAVVENLSTGQVVSHDFYAQSASLCQTNAEWIVEDASNGYGLIPFADFNTVTFTDAAATGYYGAQYGPAGANIFEIRQNNQVLTECSAGYDTVSCTYI